MVSAQNSGIPQGSVLGHILFVIFINDMPDAIACCMLLYADNAKIYNRVNNLVQSRMHQGYVINAEEWAQGWDMFFNFGKCKHVHHGSLDQNFRYSVRNNGEIKENQKVTSEKGLWVNVDNKLLFREHTGEKV